MENSLEDRVTRLEDGLAQSIKDRDAHLATMHTMIGNLATKDDLKEVSDSVQEVADSVAEMVKLTKNLKLGIHVGGKVFGISGKFVIWLGGLFFALAMITGGFKWFLTVIGLKWVLLLFAKMGL